MMNIMNRVTDKRRWEEKIYNEAIVAEIKTEALAVPSMDIFRRMMDWVGAPPKWHDLNYIPRKLTA